jgi:hypothetical protein
VYSLIRLPRTGVPCQNSRTVSELVVSAISRLLSGTR